MARSDRFHGVTLCETIAACAAVAALAAMSVPMLGALGGDVQVTISLNNLRVLGAAHATYASEWEGRPVDGHA